jgi:nitric oxide reductase subunit C
MSEKRLRNVFVFGTVLFLLVLFGMTINTLAQVNSTRTPQVTDQVVAGKQTWQSRNCNDCHTILGIGGYFAPELTKVVDRRGAAWLRSWLWDPLAVDPKATMPNQNLSGAEIENLVSFFTWVNGVDTNGWPPQPMAAGLGAGGAGGPSGALLFQQKGCSGCHRVNGQGAAGPGPDLSRIGSQPYDGLPNTPEFRALWLADPPAQKPGTLMPKTPMTQSERDALVQYLVGLK